MEAKQHTSDKPMNHRRNQKRKLNMHRNEWKWKDNHLKPMGFSKSSAKGNVHTYTGIPQETREKLNK